MSSIRHRVNFWAGATSMTPWLGRNPGKERDTMRRTTLSLLLLFTACASEKGQSTANSAPLVDVRPDLGDNAAEPQPQPEPGPAPAPKTDGLTAKLIGDASYPFTPFDKDTLHKIDALSHPMTLDFIPGGVSPSQALIDSVLGRHGTKGGGASWSPSPTDMQDIRRAMPSILARQKAEKDAWARYDATFGSSQRQLHVPPSAVNLVLRFENPTSEPIHVRTSGDGTAIRLQLTGPGAQHMLGGGDLKEIFMCGKWTTIAPGGHHDMVLNSLTYGDRAHELGAVWTQKGTYKLSMGFKTDVKKGGTVPQGCQGGGNSTELVAPPMTIDVR